MTLENIWRLPEASLAYPWKWHCLMLAPLLFVTCVTGMLHGFWGEAPYLWFKAARQSDPMITGFLRAMSSYTSTTLYICYAAILAHALAKGNRTQALFVLRFIFGALFFGVVVTQLLKAGFGMPRPGEAWPPQPFVFSRAYVSFPSGHTVAVIIAALPLAFWLGGKGGYIVLSLLAAAVGFSRLWLGEHHPVDVLGGIAIGSAAVWYIIHHPTFIGKAVGKAGGNNASARWWRGTQAGHQGIVPVKPAPWSAIDK